MEMAATAVVVAAYATAVIVAAAAWKGAPTPAVVVAPVRAAATSTKRSAMVVGRKLIYERLPSVEQDVLSE